MRLPNGYGSVTKLSGNRRRPYMIKKTTGYNSKGHPKYDIIGYTKTKQEGLQLLAEYNNDPDKVKRSTMTTKQVIEQFKKTKKYINYADKTKASYGTYFNKMQPFHNVPYQKIKGGDMQELIDQENNYSSQGSFRNAFKALDLYAMGYDIIEKMYSESLVIDEQVIETKGNPFTQEEINTLWENTDVKHVGYILIMLYSGFRITAYIEMTLDKVDLNEGTFQGGVKSKASRNRIVPIHSRIRPLVEQYVKGAPGNYLFHDGNYESLSVGQLRDRLYKVMDTFGFEHKPHDTRHTFRSRLDTAGTKATVINTLMGHAGTGTGERVYTHKTVDELREGIELID